MANLADMIMILLILTNFALLGSSLLGMCINIAAFQGIIIGVLPFVTGQGPVSIETAIMATGAMALKGVVFPWLMFRAIRETNVKREVEPFVGYSTSLMLGVVGLVASMWLAGRLCLPLAGKTITNTSLIMPVSFFTMLAGLFLIVARKKAITQVLGYLVMENGIYIFGASIVMERPWLVELGVLLDVFVAVFTMGIVIFYINREFDSIDASRLAHLRDWRRAKNASAPGI